MESLPKTPVDSLNSMLPWSNNILELAIRQFHNEGYDNRGYMEIWQVLGPALIRKLDFFSTFINENDGTVLFPDDMEPMSDEQEARIRGMRRAAPTT